MHGIHAKEFGSHSRLRFVDTGDMRDGYKPVHEYEDEGWLDQGLVEHGPMYGYDRTFLDRLAEYIAWPAFAEPGELPNTKPRRVWRGESLDGIWLDEEPPGTITRDHLDKMIDYAKGHGLKSWPRAADEFWLKHGDEPLQQRAADGPKYQVLCNPAVFKGLQVLTTIQPRKQPKIIRVTRGIYDKYIRRGGCG